MAILLTRPDETIILEARPHRLAIVGWALAGVGLVALAWRFWPGWWGSWFWMAFYGLGALTVLGKIGEWSERRLVVTDQRVIARTGFGETTVTEIPLAQVSDVTAIFTEGWPGTVKVRSSSGEIAMSFIPDPLAVREAIMNQLRTQHPG